MLSSDRIKKKAMLTHGFPSHSCLPLLTDNQTLGKLRKIIDILLQNTSNTLSHSSMRSQSISFKIESTAAIIFFYFLPPFDWSWNKFSLRYKLFKINTKDEMNVPEMMSGAEQTASIKTDFNSPCCQCYSSSSHSIFPNLPFCKNQVDIQPAGYVMREVIFVL